MPSNSLDFRSKCRVVISRQDSCQSSTWMFGCDRPFVRVLRSAGISIFTVHLATPFSHFTLDYSDMDDPVIQQLQAYGACDVSCTGRCDLWLTLERWPMRYSD
jgi:hypothetical protein